MKIIMIMLLTVFYTVSSFCQQTITPVNGKHRPVKASMERSLQSGQDFPDFPQLGMSDVCRDIELPAVVDNSTQPYLRPVFSQQGASCGQSSSVAYNFCYEINRLRNLPSDTSINQYPDHFVWNFMNATLPYYGEGVSYLHTFDILYDAGNPTEDIYGPITMDDSYYWMDGYEGYYQAMNNRISGVNSINVSTPEGLLVLKHWLHNHLEGSNVGGVANYYAGMPGPSLLPAGTPEAGKHVQIEFEFPSSHALTIVGYNDSIRFDMNGDGLYTNHLDITDDGVVDMKDWEIGGLKYVNSYGTSWADSGFCYMLYRTLALKYGQGGIWNNSVHILHPDTAYKPLLTAKVKLQHNKRGRIKLMAGVSSDTARYYPEHTISFSIFNYQGLDYYMAGNKLPEGKTLEFGLDFTPLLSYINPGDPVRIFLIVDEKDPDGKGEGTLLNYSVIKYTAGDPLEFINSETPLAIIDNGQTIASVSVGTDTEPISIQPDGPVVITPGLTNTTPFSASGGFPPYSWKLKRLYTESVDSDAYSISEGEIQVPSDPHTGYAAVSLPFQFPFFGQLYDTLYMHVNGYLMFDKQDMPFFYLLYDEPYLRQIKAIAGYMNKDLSLFSTGDHISVISSSGQVSFNWRISDFTKQYSAIFTVSVYPDGNIRYHYGTSVAGEGYLPVIGLSNGNRDELTLSGYSGKKAIEGQILNFFPAMVPLSTTLSEEGVLTISPEPGLFSDEVIIQVSDYQRLMTEKRILITTGPEVKVRLADSLVRPAPGSNLPLIVEIFNHAGQSLTVQYLSISPASSNATVQGEPVSDIEILPGQSVMLENIFILQIHDTISSPQVAKIMATWTSGNESVKKSEEFNVDLPFVVASPPVIADGDNFTADPGEEVPLVFRIFNYGNASAGNLTATLTIQEAFAAVNGENIQNTGELKGYAKKNLVYMLKVNEAAPQGRLISVYLILANAQKTVFEGSFDLTIGKPTILISDLDKNQNSAVHIAAALRQLDIGYEYTESIDSSLFEFDYNFLSLGAYTQNHLLTPHEDSLYVEFLNRGKNLYLESGAFFKQTPVTMLRSLLRAEGSYLAWVYPADTIAGIVGTPADGIQIEYLGDWKRSENLVALEPSIPWFRDKNSGLDFVVALDSGNYRSIASTIEFGGTFMFDSPGRPELMRRYLEFLGYQIDPLSVVFKPSTTSVCRGSSVTFQPVSNGSPTSYQWTFEGGTPASWQGPLATIKYETAGIYPVSLTVSDGTNSNTFTLDNLITVDNCTDIEEFTSPEFRLYPNPADDMIFIETSSVTNRNMEVRIVDLQGRNILQLNIAESSSINSVPVSGLVPGMYLVVIRSDAWSGSSKLVIK
ncbi:MAG: PKD domain-containing protein [Lentimicrobium sp.]